MGSERRAVGEHSFPRGERLTRADDYQAVFHRGARVERPSVLILWRGVPGRRKAGFAVSRQIQGATRRNRARRRIREAYRVSRRALPEGVHLVVVARPRAEVGAYAEILEDVREAIEAVARRSRRGGG